jgi:hypothetical protein
MHRIYQLLASLGLCCVRRFRPGGRRRIWGTPPAPVRPLDRRRAGSRLVVPGGGDLRYLVQDRRRRPVLWGCDIEEIQPHLLIRDPAFANPKR